MKKLNVWMWVIVGLLGLPVAVLGQRPPPDPATVADVIAGTSTRKYISPKVAADVGLAPATNGVTLQQVTNVAQAISATNSTTGNAATATTALAMTNVITVSSRGIANGTATVANNGHPYGPDTPGTTTSGLQEALTLLQTGSNAGPYMVNAKIELTAGDFFFTNVLTYSNSYTASLEIAGAGMLNTTLIYAGATTVSNTISLTGGAHSGGVLNIPLHVTLRDMTVTALTQATNVLVYIGGSSYQRVANMNFTGWNVRTNQDTGSGVSFTPNHANYPPGLVGLRINTALDHSTVLENIFFAGLAVGARVKSDHPSGRDLKFSNISYGSYGSTNIWPTNTIYNIGAGIIVEGNAYDSLWVYGHLYALRCGFAAVGCSVAPTLIGWHFESAGFPVVSDTELCPKLIDPVSTSGDFASFDQYKLYTPTSSNYTTNYYMLTSEDHEFGYQRGMGRYDGGDYSFFIRRANSIKMYMDGASDYLVADGEGVFDIIPNGMRATNSPSANKVWKAIDGTTAYWGDDNNSGGGSSIFYTNTALGGYTNVYGLRLYSNASMDATNIVVGGVVGIDATGVSVSTKVTLTSADQTFAVDTVPTTIYADGSIDLAGGAVNIQTDGDIVSTATFTGNGSGLTNLDGSSIASGTVADARIASTIARDSEVAAAYQPLDADLTDLADGSLTGSKVGTGINADNITSGTMAAGRLPAMPYEFALSDETTALTTGTAKLTWRAPFAMTITAVRASLSTASSSGTPTVNIKEGGSTIFSIKLTIDANEKTSTTAASAAVISDSSIADDAEITFDIDTAGTGAAGLKVKIYYTR